jgi:serine/threonine-protein kinase HipA
LSKASRTPIYVSVDRDATQFCGVLWCEVSRGKEIFAFEYSQDWLTAGSKFLLDPALGLFEGPQYARRQNFGIFLDSSPDRWGRLLIKRREAMKAREESRPVKALKESDYLLGVHDTYRIGALRFQTNAAGPFLDNDASFAAPPWSSLRELEHAAWEIESTGAEDRAEYKSCLRMLIAPGGSLGGARPKSSVEDDKGHLWLAKFPGRQDEFDVGAWERVVHTLAEEAGLRVPEADVIRLSERHHTFLVKRFDRTADGRRLFFTSAMTALGLFDGADAAEGASYLQLAELITRFGKNPIRDLRELWMRIAFNMLVSNTDDHLRNHGFLIDESGWTLSPAFDINPNPTGDGLKLSVSEHDNSQDLDLLLSVAKHFRLNPKAASQILEELVATVGRWRTIATQFAIPKREQELMEAAFRLAGPHSTSQR